MYDLQRCFNLLEKIRHELTVTSGLKAFDGLSETVNTTETATIISKDDIIDLDFKELIDEIDSELEGDSSIDAFVLDNCTEWANLITELSYNEIELCKKKDAYQALSDNLLEEARTIKEETGDDIIKAQYGGNNDKTRKKYVEETLADEDKEIKELEFSIDYLKRRISYLKSLVYLKTVLIEAKKWIKNVWTANTALIKNTVHFLMNYA